MLAMVNTRKSAASHASQLSVISQSIPHPGSFRDILVDEDEIPLLTERPCKTQFADTSEGGVISSNPKSHPVASRHLSEFKQGAGHILKAAALQFCKMSLKLVKYKVATHLMQGLYFSPGLKILGYAWRTASCPRIVIQLFKDLTTKHVYTEDKFNLILVEEGQQNFKGVIQHLTYAFKSKETDSCLIVLCTANGLCFLGLSMGICSCILYLIRCTVVHNAHLQVL